MSHDAMRAEYAERRARALAMGGAAKLAQRKEEGLLNVRERIAHLLDAASFMESGLFAMSDRPEMRNRTPADGKVVGFGKVEGRMIGVAANDFTVTGASSTRTNGRKIDHVKDVATKRGFPMVFLGESTGARMPDIMGAKGIGNGDARTRYLRGRETPWASAVLGPCYGSSSWYAAVGFHRHAHDLVVDTDEQALDAIRRFLSFMPSHHNEAPPTAPVPAGSDEPPGHDAGDRPAKPPPDL